MTELTLEQAIRDAIETERAAARFYGIMKGFTDNPVIEGFLAKLQRQEEQHAADIEKLKEELGAGELPETGDAGLFESLRRPDWAITEEMLLGEAIDVALDAEKRAVDFYKALASVVSGRAREFFAAMARVEAEHVKALEEEAKKWDVETIPPESPA